MSDNFYYKWANWYKNEIYLKKIDAVVHVEGKDDKLFWKQVFEHVGVKVILRDGTDNPDDKSSGKSICLKYLNYLDKRFFICIDSDYDYILQKHPEYNPQNFVLQTYTYAVENHYLASDNKSQRFLKKYSNIIYNAFLNHLRDGGSTNTFCNEIAPNNATELALNKLQEYLQDKYSEDLHNHYSISGLTADNTYLFIKAKLLKNKMMCDNKLSYEHFPMNKIFKDIAYIQKINEQ
ncbi:MAG: DUF4435 domain-containing protein [Dysgonamonadaceae bacterium]|jgi:hypothetical protein|nr:DUF4435 domain-containing protein [Dysgonamonadaceae bacterium]